MQTWEGPGENLSIVWYGRHFCATRSEEVRKFSYHKACKHLSNWIFLLTYKSSLMQTFMLHTIRIAHHEINKSTVYQGLDFALAYHLAFDHDMLLQDPTIISECYINPLSGCIKRLLQLQVGSLTHVYMSTDSIRA